mmetsp:Transcript_14962/g.26568  ORF Transcript_14962/g.26568 Transcript_14962/m.26568 type:complete len:89 (-) Transcript_14962:2-268(-)
MGGTAKHELARPDGHVIAKLGTNKHQALGQRVVIWGLPTLRGFDKHLSLTREALAKANMKAVQHFGPPGALSGLSAAFQRPSAAYHGP